MTQRSLEFSLGLGRPLSSASRRGRAANPRAVWPLVALDLGRCVLPLAPEFRQAGLSAILIPEAASWLEQSSDRQPCPRDDDGQEPIGHPVRRSACAPAAVIAQHARRSGRSDGQPTAISTSTAIRAPAIPPRLGSPPGPPLRGDPSNKKESPGGEPIGRRNERGRMMVTHGPRVMLVTGTATRELFYVAVPSSTGARAAIRIPDSRWPSVSSDSTLAMATAGLRVRGVLERTRRIAREACQGARRKERCRGIGARGAFPSFLASSASGNAEPPKRARRTPSSARPVQSCACV